MHRGRTGPACCEDNSGLRYIAARPVASAASGDVEGRRARRAPMSFGLGGIARVLIYLVVEDRRHQMSAALTCPHHL
ncbi:hypothetical protein XI07_12310 [Bradyrhizobium sp. CCBAU 11445]|nr:hypothetical protein [Bradyrhizobium sp. CCBAU 21359]MDA9482797.1 hypothetical protein [Bradyrhizobium sp. CCBAU 11445]